MAPLTPCHPAVGHPGRVLVTISHPALMAVVISTAVVTLAFTVMTLRFIR